MSWAISTLLTFLHVLVVPGIFLHVVILLGTSLRVITRRPPSGVALAWMFLVASLPVVGFLFYLMIGERRVGLHRARRIAAVRSDYAKLAQRVIDEGLTQVHWDKHRPEARGMDRLGTCLVGVPTVAGCTARFYSESEQILRTIAQDIDSAHESVLIEFYIWNEGGAADEVPRGPGSRVRNGAFPVACWSTPSAQGLGGGAGSPNGFAKRASRSSPLCPSTCCKSSSRAMISACTARSSWSMAASPGPAA